MNVCLRNDHRNQVSTEGIEERDIISLPDDLLLLIFSYLDCMDLANVMGTCRILKNVGTIIWPLKAAKWVLTDKFPQMTAWEIVNCMAPAVKNYRVIRGHVHYLMRHLIINRIDKKFKPLPPGTVRTTVELFLRSQKDLVRRSSRIKFVSTFIATVGLPITDSGLVKKKLPHLYLDKEVPYFKTRMKIFIAEKLMSEPTQRAVILKIPQKNEIAHRNLHLTNEYFKYSLYEKHLDNISKAPLIADLITQLIFGQYLKYSRLCLEIFFAHIEEKTGAKK